jgi:hypothetical protein
MATYQGVCDLAVMLDESTALRYIGEEKVVCSFFSAVFR